MKLCFSNLRCIALPGFIALLVILGGGTPVWVQGGALLCVGLFLTLKPPQLSLGRSFDWVLLGFLVVSLLALLPAEFLPHGSWRDIAIEQYHIKLPWTVATLLQPLLEHCLFLLSAIGFLYLALSFQYDLELRRRSIRCMIIFATLLAIGMLIGNGLGVKYPFAKDSTIFSYFPNRNQTSTFFCMSAVMAFSWSFVAFRCRRYRWAGPAVGCFALLVLAVFESVSRAGMILLFVGAFSFFVYKPFSHKLRFLLRVIIPSFVVLVSMLFVLGGGALDRIEKLIAEKSDYRIEVYQDTFGVILDYPLNGVGGGNFSAVFPQYEDKSAIDQRLLHPESDWFWFTSEVGVLGFALLLGLLFLLIKGIFPFERGEREAVRVIPSTALTVFVLHSFVDVPAHRMGTLFFAIFLLGLAVSASKKTKTLFPPWSFRISGVILSFFGVLWILADAGMPSLHSSVRMNYDDKRILEAERARDLVELGNATDLAIAARPSDWWPYFERAKLSLEQGNIDAADADFDRALFLEPSAQEVAYYEGLSWLSVSPSRAYDAWSQALKRKASNREGMYENMRLAIIGHKDFYPYFRKLTTQDSNFRYYYLEAIDDADFSKEMNWEMTSGPKLEAFQEQQQIVLLRRWMRIEGKESLHLFLKKHSELLDSVPELKAEALGVEHRYEEASLLLLDSEPEISVPGVSESRSPKELARIFQKNPSDFWVGVSLFQHYLELESYDQAVAILEKLKSQGKQPLFVYYWEARIYTEMAQYEQAWAAWSDYLERKSS